jgi:deoxyadenosine/deoxycytidine kinase
VDVLLERIARRGIRYEKHIDAAYLEKLIDAYTRYFHQYSASPLLIVNAAAIDPVSDSRDFEELFEAIRRTQRGRHYFNPLKD